MMFMGKPIEYWVELQAMAESMSMDDTIVNNIALLRVARAASALEFPIYEFIQGSKYEADVNEFIEALKALPEGLL